MPAVRATSGVLPSVCRPRNSSCLPPTGGASRCGRFSAGDCRCCSSSQSRVRSLRRTAPAGGRLAAPASRPPHGCARNPAICRAEGRHAADTRVARCAFASQPRNRRGLPGKRHPERSADRRQRKNREPPGLGCAGNHPAHPQRNHQRPPGRPGGGTRRQRRGTKLTRQARTCRRRRGTRPCADRSAGPRRARPAGPGSASADTASRALKREVPLSKINSAAWRDFPVHCYSRAATCSPDTSAAPMATTERHPLLVKSVRHPCGARAGRGSGPLTTSAVLMTSLPSFHSDPLQHTVQAPREGP